MAAPSFSAPLLRAINHVLDQAAWARRRLQPFAGQTVGLRFADFSMTFLFGGDGRVETSGGDGQPADLEIVLPADAPLLALQGRENLMKAVQINGPVELANTLSVVLRDLRWDFEEDLSKVVGDIAAHRLASALKGFVRWQRQAVHNAAGNAGEYVVEERRTLVKAGEFKRLAEEIGALRADLERVESRINRLGNGTA
jgi:ubiquinone biosynthesis accessory factor UbiJ